MASRLPPPPPRYTFVSVPGTVTKLGRARLPDCARPRALHIRFGAWHRGETVTREHPRGRRAPGLARGRAAAGRQEGADRVRARPGRPPARRVARAPRGPRVRLARRGRRGARP